MRKGTQFLQYAFLSSLLAISAQGMAAEKTIDIMKLSKNPDGKLEKIGTITFKDTDKGLLVQPRLTGLEPGEHGFHIHENASCNGEMTDHHFEPGKAGGDHLDPNHTGKHLGPYSSGHIGDLPTLMVDNKGESQFAVVAPRLTVANISNHSVMIHEHGDNYSDSPKPMGGGGPRVACGVIK